MTATNSAWKTYIPWMLICFRGVIAPALFWWALLHDNRWLLGALMLAEFVSDWLDGILARRWNTVTVSLRKADSRADTIFCLNAFAGGLFGRGELIQPLLPFLIGLLILELICQLTNFARFGCLTATHAYLCKAWAVALCFATTDLFAFHAVRESMWICLALGYVAYIDVLAILWIMPIPAVDVPTSFHAWRRRAQFLTPNND